MSFNGAVITLRGRPVILDSWNRQPDASASPLMPGNERDGGKKRKKPAGKTPTGISCIAVLCD